MDSELLTQYLDKSSANSEARGRALAHQLLASAPVAAATPVEATPQTVSPIQAPIVPPRPLAPRLLHLLRKAASNGHCAMEEARIHDALNDTPADQVDSVIESLISQRAIVRYDGSLALGDLAQKEAAVSRHLARLAAHALPWKDPIRLSRLLPKAAQLTGLERVDAQWDAVNQVLAHKVSIITGGPGTGKTALVRLLVEVLHLAGRDVSLCSPTGKAANRLSEATGRDASTIHRLLEPRHEKGGFSRDEGNPLDVDVLVVDEASMLDIRLTDSLLSALPDAAVLVLIGDTDQLPSVGPGAVLRDLIACERIPTARLSQVRRQKEDSHILVNSSRVRRGEIPVSHGSRDFVVIEVEDPERIPERIIDIVARQIPERRALDPLRDVQVLSPVKAGLLGVQALNQQLKARLNPHEGPQRFAPGDRVIQTENDYNLNVFNGDMGYIEHTYPDSTRVVVRFDDKLVHYDADQVEMLEFAYAMTVHKSQGSEYPAVIIPLVTSMERMLYRHLLYTAITRGVGLVVVIGQKDAITMAVEEREDMTRATTLKARLREQITLPKCIAGIALCA